MNMKVMGLPALCALAFFSIGVQASDTAAVRPGAEVLPGVTVTADNISTSRVPGSAGDLTFTGNVSISSSVGVREAAWAAFSPASMVLSVDGDDDSDTKGLSECRNGGYYMWIGSGAPTLVGYPTRENPYKPPGGGKPLYCVGSVIYYV